MNFQIFLDESGRKTNKSWLLDNNIRIYSTHNEKNFCC